MNDVLTQIREYAELGARLRSQFFTEKGDLLRKAAFKTAISIATGGKLLICGNGGSAADAQHVAGEFVNRFLIDRPALPAIALTTDTSTMTAIANDFDFVRVFARQIEALGKPGDVLLAISTSGNSPNVLAAAHMAREKSIQVIGLTGGGGGKLAPLSDILLDVPSDQTPLIQEVHLTVEHLLCSLVDYYLFENVGELEPFLNEES